MSDKEKGDDLLDQLFPVGGERWIKVKYHDKEKSIKAFTWRNDQKENERLIAEKGYETLSIGVKPEFEPQVSAIMDLQDEVLQIVLGMVNYDTDNYNLNTIREVFKDKIKEVSERCVKHVDDLKNG